MIGSGLKLIVSSISMIVTINKLGNPINQAVYGDRDSNSAHMILLWNKMDLRLADDEFIPPNIIKHPLTGPNMYRFPIKAWFFEFLGRV